MRILPALGTVCFLAACDGPSAVSVTDAPALGDASTTLLIAVRGRGGVTHVADQSGATSCSTLPANTERADCTRTFALGTLVTLQTTAAAGWSFDHWGGACAGRSTCAVTMNERRVVEVIFRTAVVPPANHTLRIIVRGRGEVQHTSDAGGAVSCAAQLSTNDVAECTRTFVSGSEVVLQAFPAAGFIFTGWSAPCSGVGPCTLRMNENRVIEVRFRG